MTPCLKVRGLRTYFHSGWGVARAVDGVDLELGRGRTLGLIGESGCGKSLTALSIMGLVDPPGRVESGSSIEFEGRQLVGLPEAEMEHVRGNEIAMIFQEPMSSLNPVYPIGYQVAEAVRAHEDVNRDLARARAIELLRMVHIPSPEQRASDFPHQLSGGMRQRVMIAIAIACRPHLLIADEPTTALDVTVQAQVLSLLAELKEKLDMALLLITHDLGVVAQLADEVAVMYAGRIVERGPLPATFAEPKHPYTEALLKSIPALGLTKEHPLQVIAGNVPSPLSWPEGCRFSPRCEHVFDLCRNAYPDLAGTNGQAVACWLDRVGGSTRRSSSP